MDASVASRLFEVTRYAECGNVQVVDVASTTSRQLHTPGGSVSPGVTGRHSTNTDWSPVSSISLTPTVSNQRVTYTLSRPITASESCSVSLHLVVDFFLYLVSLGFTASLNILLTVSKLKFIEFLISQVVAVVVNLKRRNCGFLS